MFKNRGQSEHHTLVDGSSARSIMRDSEPSLLSRLCLALIAPFTECAAYDAEPPALAQRVAPPTYYRPASSAAAGGRGYADVLPCGLTRHQVRLLEEREITPDDYTLLLILEHAQHTPRRAGLRAADLSRALQAAVPAVARTRSSCAVCLELVQPWERGAKLRCGHAFHRKCITTWLQTKNSCPLCTRKAID